jgi:hypothetical protein
MTLAEINAKLKISVARPDLTSDGDDNYSAYVNEAQKEICRLHSFNWMRTTASVTILAGTSSIALAANFKEFTSDLSPVHRIDDSTGNDVLTPVAVWTPEKVKRWGQTTLFDASINPIYLDRSVDPPALTVGNGPLTEGAEFQISYYTFLTDLSADADHNTLTDDYGSMLLQKAKGLAFEDVNDFEMVEACEKVFIMKLARAKQSDMYSRVAGQNLHM